MAGGMFIVVKRKWKCRHNLAHLSKAGLSGTFYKTQLMKFPDSILPVSIYSSMDPSSLDILVPQFMHVKTQRQTFSNCINCLERIICLLDKKWFLTTSQALPSGRADVQMDLWDCYYIFWSFKIVLHCRERQILPQQFLSISWNLAGILSGINQQKCNSKTEELGSLILPVN